MLFEITVAIVFAKLFNYIFEKLKQPGVIGEIIAGIILGPCLIGTLSGSSINLFGYNVYQFQLNFLSDEFKEFAFIGVIFLLFIVGLETNMDDLKKTRKAGAYAGIGSIVVPFFVGFLIGIFFNMNITQSLAIGAICLATSATIAIRIFSDMDLLSTRVGLTLHTAVVLNDILAIFVFALVFGTGNSFILILQILLFFILTIGVGFFAVKFTSKNNISRKAPVFIITIGLVICFLFAALAENFGITAIIGAFIAGIFVRKMPHASMLIDYIKTIGYAFFIPLFFVWVGASFNFMFLLQSKQIENLIFFIIVFVVSAHVANFLGGYIGARLSGLSKRESISVGSGMLPVMGTGLIIVTTAIDKGIFGEADGYLANQIRIATLLLVIVSCLITPFLLKKSMRTPLQKHIGKTKPSFYHHPHCPECFSALRLIPEKFQWYCDLCQKFMKIPVKNPIKKQVNYYEKIDKYIKYIIGATTIIICVFAVHNLESTSFFEKISAITGVFIGTTLAFLTIKYFFLYKKNFSIK
ncbi:MAG: cation:proton antiporter [Candidatus Thermoplasmatota archaeon]|jgi:Kef-type K+ transport system membrane component KefB|nr:cation:proton antiporter [Candidatus Thermoplasmatota archaeon]